MTYQYTEYPYKLQPDEMFNVTDVSGSPSDKNSTIYQMAEYQKLVSAGKTEEAGKYLADHEDLDKCIIDAEMINTLQERIHATQDYALSLKTQGWYSENGEDDPYEAARLKGSIWNKQVENGSLEDNEYVSVNQYVLTENGKGYKRCLVNGLIYMDDNKLYGIEPFGEIKSDKIMIPQDGEYKDISGLFAATINKSNITGGVNVEMRDLNNETLPTAFNITLDDFGFKASDPANLASLLGEANRKSATGVGTSYNIVTGVKGNAESTYRKGYVNLTPHNLGAVQLNGDTMTGNLNINRKATATKDSNPSTGLFLYNTKDHWVGSFYVQPANNVGSNTSPSDLIIGSYYANMNMYTYGYHKDIRLMCNANKNGQSSTTMRGARVTAWTSDDGKYTRGAITPSHDSQVFCGWSDHRWQTIYSRTGSISTSDRNEKHDIIKISDKYENLFMDLKPRTYMFNEGDRTHLGFIAQDVEMAATAHGLTTMDFAALCKDEKHVKNADGESTPELVRDKNGNIEYSYSLRYEEFIALNTHMIQKLMKRVDELEKQLAEKGGDSK